MPEELLEAEMGQHAHRRRERTMRFQEAPLGSGAVAGEVVLRPAFVRATREIGRLSGEVGARGTKRHILPPPTPARMVSGRTGEPLAAIYTRSAWGRGVTDRDHVSNAEERLASLLK